MHLEGAVCDEGLIQMSCCCNNAATMLQRCCQQVPALILPSAPLLLSLRHGLPKPSPPPALNPVPFLTGHVAAGDAYAALPQHHDVLGLKPLTPQELASRDLLHLHQLQPYPPAHSEHTETCKCTSLP